MSEVDGPTRTAIDKIIERILREGDLGKPPIQIINILYFPRQQNLWVDSGSGKAPSV